MMMVMMMMMMTIKMMMMMMMMMLPGRQSGVARQSEKYVRASAHLPCCLQVIRVNYDYDEDDDGIHLLEYPIPLSACPSRFSGR